MDIFFTDPDQVPLPPDEVHILNIKVDPYPDGMRVRLFVELTPFQKKPSGDILITNRVGETVASTSFIEAVTPKFEMTLHLRPPRPGEYTAKLVLFYTDEIEEDDSKGAAYVRPEKKNIDEMEKTFTIEG